jgi:DNA-binding transcriptional MerR regulator
MEMRVEQLSARGDVTVDTIRYYQSKGLLDPPRREGRVAWYGDRHLERLARIRSLQGRGFTLATIVRLVSGELDSADEALLGELSGWRDEVPGSTAPEAAGAESDTSGSVDRIHSEGIGSDRIGSDRIGSESGPTLTLDELAEATGVPLALLKAVEAEGLLIPRRITGQNRYTEADVAAARSGLLLLEWGIPLSALLDLARRHHEATEAVAREAVTMFSTYVRGPLRSEHPAIDGEPRADAADTPSDEPHIERLLQAYAELLPAVNTLVGHHFTRTLISVALDHVEQVGSDAERRAIGDEAGVDMTGRAGDPQDEPQDDPQDEPQGKPQDERPVADKGPSGADAPDAADGRTLSVRR